MAEIRHRVGIAAPQRHVYETLEGGQAAPYPDDMPISTWG